MIDILQFLAAFCAALFAGAALYICVAEHTARMQFDTRAAAEQWAPSYKRATWMQASLAMVSLLVIKPTNDALLAPGRLPFGQLSSTSGTS